MATKQKKVQKQRQRRRENQRQKLTLVSRHAQLALSPEHPVYRCEVNPDWREQGMASILFSRRTPTGAISFAAFLVDVWAMGLKDVSGETDMSVDEFDDMVKAMHDRIGSKAIDVNLARHLVFGGIDLARRLGFRLPRKYERWTGLLGPLPDGGAPDMSLFLRDGQIVLTCPRQQLNERLIGCSVDSFLQRADVIFDETIDVADDFDEHDFEMLQKHLERLGEITLTRALQWCFARGESPHRLLKSAIVATHMSNASIAVESSADELGDEPTKQQTALAQERAIEFMLAKEGATHDEVLAALDQFYRFMEEVPYEEIERILTDEIDTELEENERPRATR